MTAKKNQRKSPNPVSRTISGLMSFVSTSKPGRTALLGGIMLLGFWLIMYSCWQKVSNQVLASSDYRVGLEDIVVSSPPSWLHCDVRKDVFEDLSVDGSISIMDANVTKRFKDVFAMHPWVERVTRVSKRFPSRIEVELKYRSPACIIAASGQWFPVDEKGYVLRLSDFSTSDLQALPKVVGIDTLPVISEGAYWNDKQVDAAARIGAALRPVWKEMDLNSIQLARTQSYARQNEMHNFELTTKGGTIIIWGQSPAEKESQRQTDRQLSNQEKVARLKRYFDQHGTLDVPGNQILDLRFTPSEMANAR